MLLMIKKKMAPYQIFTGFCTRAQPLVEDIARKQQAAEKAAEEEVLAAPVPRARKSARLSGTPNNNMRGQRTRGRPARAEVAQGRKVPRKRQKDGVRDSAKEMETGGAEDTTDGMQGYVLNTNPYIISRIYPLQIE